MFSIPTKFSKGDRVSFILKKFTRVVCECCGAYKSSSLENPEKVVGNIEDVSFIYSYGQIEYEVYRVRLDDGQIYIREEFQLTLEE